MENNNETHAVIYCRFVEKDHENLSNIKEIEKYKMNNCEIKSISGKNNNRREILDWFKRQDKNRKILVNVGILKEGIDICCINEICFNDHKYSFFDIV